MIAALDPDLYVSANPGCLLQGSRRRFGGAGPADLQPAHPVELLDASIRGVAPPERM